MIREKQIEILKMDGCTEIEAKKYIDRDQVCIFNAEDFETHFDEYMHEWDMDEDDLSEFKKMVADKIPVRDWGVVIDNDGNTFYLMYKL